jgi:hypothetical protein
MNSSEDYRKMVEAINLAIANGGVFFIASEKSVPILGKIKEIIVEENLVNLIPEICLVFDYNKELKKDSVIHSWSFTIRPSSGFIAKTPSGCSGPAYTASAEGAVIKIFCTMESFNQAVGEKFGSSMSRKIAF